MLWSRRNWSSQLQILRSNSLGWIKNKLFISILTKYPYSAILNPSRLIGIRLIGIKLIGIKKAGIKMQRSITDLGRDILQK